MIMNLSTGVKGRDFRAESCRWISVQTMAPFYPKCAISPKVCNFTNHKNSTKISALVQYQARFILISEENFLCSCNLDVFCDR